MEMIMTESRKLLLEATGILHKHTKNHIPTFLLGDSISRPWGRIRERSTNWSHSIRAASWRSTFNITIIFSIMILTSANLKFPGSPSHPQKFLSASLAHFFLVLNFLQPTSFIILPNAFCPYYVCYYCIISTPMFFYAILFSHKMHERIFPANRCIVLVVFVFLSRNSEKSSQLNCCIVVLVVCRNADARAISKLTVESWKW